MWLTCLFVIVVLQRVIELFISRRNGRNVRAMGGTEYGQSHYKLFVLLHSSFLVSLYVESRLVGYTEHPLVTLWTDIAVAAFITVQVIRIWCIRALGVFWNTRIFVVQNADIVRKGPYRVFRHPNYLVVVAEFLLLPLIFHSFWTGGLFFVLNLLLLTYRIRIEESALASQTDYGTAMVDRHRVFPHWIHRE
jgi:methyltransferase